MSFALTLVLLRAECTERNIYIGVKEKVTGIYEVKKA